MKISDSLGYLKGDNASPILSDLSLKEYVNLRLLSMGLPISEQKLPIAEIAGPLLEDAHNIRSLLNDFRCPADQRIVDFCDQFFEELPKAEKHGWIPETSFISDKHGVSRMLSLPANGDEFHSEYVDSYRVYQGVLHNPAIDKRTTKGVFHIADGGFEVPADKIAVPKIAFARMLKHACNPPKSLLELPFTANQKKKAYTFVSTYLKPTVFPEIPGYKKAKKMEIRFFTPGSLVNFLDMVESIFGNAGSPITPLNDPALNPEEWTGHTGCIIVAPHLTKLTKKELGLPHISEATERQKAEGMCWEHEDEIYHSGKPFKIMARDEKGVIISIIADSYNGYGKKEIKTQMSYSANLLGLCEEEHSGGSLTFASYDLGDDFKIEYVAKISQTAKENFKHYRDQLDIIPEGYAIDKEYRDIIYVPEDAHFFKFDQKITWQLGSIEYSIPLEPGKTYIYPNGYKVELTVDKLSKQWKMIGTVADGVFCHKPSTVSGGGKSEISKSIEDNISIGSLMVNNFIQDCRCVDDILKRDYRNRYKNKTKDYLILDRKRTLGNIVTMFQESDAQTNEYNQWIASVPEQVKMILFSLKLHYREDWGDDWISKFSVDFTNGMAGHELKYLDQKIMVHYLRMGFRKDNATRYFSLREDFCAAKKISMEDDITATVTVPSRFLKKFNRDWPSVKFVENCEYRLYQRPDDAVEPGYDHVTEYDMTQNDIFFCNYAPLTKSDVREIIKDSISFSKYTLPLQKYLRQFVEDDNAPQYIVCPSFRRIMPNGEYSSNVRYLQNREDIVNQRLMRICEMGMRFTRNLLPTDALYFSVDTVIAGRRNNPPEQGIKPLCVHNPLHYFELPELLMEFASNVTGKSPSTTGAGLEGVMTKRPFNALSQIIDLNNAFLSFVVSGYPGFISSAGYIGPDIKVGHDISYLIPEIFCRMTPQERSPEFLIENGYLDKVEDFTYKGKKIEASRLGYRINRKFLSLFLGRILTAPESVFCDEILKPELQNMEVFVESIENIIDAHKRCAMQFIEDGSIEYACPPIKALLYIMAYGEYEGMTLHDPKFRDLFKQENVMSSDWYQDRLQVAQEIEICFLRKCMQHMKQFLKSPMYKNCTKEINLKEKIAACEERIEHILSDEYLKELYGTIGADPMVLGR